MLLPVKHAASSIATSFGSTAHCADLEVKYCSNSSERLGVWTTHPWTICNDTVLYSIMDEPNSTQGPSGDPALPMDWNKAATVSYIGRGTCHGHQSLQENYGFASATWHAHVTVATPAMIWFNRSPESPDRTPLCYTLIQCTMFLLYTSFISSALATLWRIQSIYAKPLTVYNYS